jgi:hypothetical protein
MNKLKMTFPQKQIAQILNLVQWYATHFNFHVNNFRVIKIRLNSQLCHCLPASSRYACPN